MIAVIAGFMRWAWLELRILWHTRRAATLARVGPAMWNSWERETFHRLWLVERLKVEELKRRRGAGNHEPLQPPHR